MSDQIDSTEPFITLTLYWGGHARGQCADVHLQGLEALRELRNAYEALWGAKVGTADRETIKRWQSYIDAINKRLGE